MEENREIAPAEIEQCKAALGGLYAYKVDERMARPLHQQVAALVDLVTGRQAFKRSIPIEWSDSDELIHQVVVRLLREIERLRAENQAFRDQFRDVDEMLAEWEGHTPTNPPPGWAVSADTDGFTGRHG